MRRPLLLLAAGGLLAVTGCGSKHAAAPTPAHGSTSSSTGTVTAPSAKSSTTPGALQAEAQSAAAGDIPDNQVFLTFHNPRAGYSMKYPEGWAQTGSGDRVTFRDKNNIVRVVVATGNEPTVAQVRAEVGSLAGAQVTGGPTSISIGGHPAIKVVYATESAPNSVTGKRVRLVVDRYYVGSAGKVAVVDLGTPQGVDNVDAYRLMIQSFRWR